MVRRGTFNLHRVEWNHAAIGVAEICLVFRAEKIEMGRYEDDQMNQWWDRTVAVAEPHWHWQRKKS
jgi:hypothetical protein